MNIIIDENAVSQNEQAEIKYILHRILVGDKDYQWQSQPDEIIISRRLTGGRSSAKIFEANVRWGNSKLLKVIKFGLGNDLKDELEGYKRLKKMSLNGFFTPIEATTPGVVNKEFQMISNQLEAIVYAHGNEWIGGKNLKTFEEIARSAIGNGGSDLDNAVYSIEKLFTGIENYLYKRDVKCAKDIPLSKFWNLRLGPDGVIEVEEFIEVKEFKLTKRLLKFGSPTKDHLIKACVFPDNVTSTELWKDDKIKPGDFIYLEDLKVEWWINRLMGRCEKHSHFLRFEIITTPNKNIRDVATSLKEDAEFSVYGKLKSIRLRTYKEHFITGLKELKIEDDTMKESDPTVVPGATVPDPFIRLHKILETNEAQIFTSFVHGDLNPRNILVIENKNPCLIDYASVNNEETLLSDFVRLEGCLARDTLPQDLTWKQHARLQRLLAAACRLEDETIEKFVQVLAQERKELASAFHLLYNVRKASKNAYPKAERYQWYKDYHKQLFLFAHLTLKWDEQTPQALRATAAMAGVAAEAISKEDVYRWWSLEELKSDGLEIIKLLKKNPESSLSEMANFARGIDHWKKRERYRLSLEYRDVQDEYQRESAIDNALNDKLSDPLVSEFEGLRDKFVHMDFINNANAILSSLKSQKAHETYISLCAYIDLKGRISPSSARTRLTFEESLQDERLLVEQEMRRLGGEEKNAIDFIAEETGLVLIGEAGGGKSTVAREWKFRLAESIRGEGRDKKYTPRLPIYVLAQNLPACFKNWSEEDPQSIVDIITNVICRDQNSQDSITVRMVQNLQDLLTVGAVHLIVDSLNELDEEDKQKVADWIILIRKTYRRTPVLVCHREYTYMPGLLPFPVVTLQKVNEDQAKNYISNYLRENKVTNHEIISGQLIRFLLEEGSEHVRELARTPLFLWMIVYYYQENRTIPKNRGELFKQFSKWYIEGRYHTEHGEPVHYKYGYPYKETLLGWIGYELVKRSITYIAEKEIESIIREKISKQENDVLWNEILEEIIDSEMLKRNNDKLEFLHQAFQEFFAACHFLKYEAIDEDTIREKVKRPRWYYTFETLLGFAGESPKVVSQIIKIALEIDPDLTARFFRVAEGVDPELINQFIEAQEKILRNPEAGSFAHKQAALALSQYGRDPVFKILIGLGSDLRIPIESRVEILMHLSNLLKNPYFESKKIEREKELQDLLEHVFKRPEDSKIYLVCIHVVRTLNFRNLNDYLVDFIENEEAEWSLRRVAWDACEEMGSRLTTKRKEIYTEACLKRLEQTEEELFHKTSKLDRMKELNEERCYLLKHMATPQNIPLLLARRFSLEIHNTVEEIVEDVVGSNAESPIGIERAWQILRVQTADESMIEDWLSLIREGDSLLAAAAAHQLLRVAKQGKVIPSNCLQNLLNYQLKPEMLLLVGELISVSGDKNLAEPLEQFLRDFIKRTESSNEFEALAKLAFVLEKLDSQRGRHFITLAVSFFYPEKKQIPEGQYPMRLMSYQTFLSETDIKALINRGGEDAHAAIFCLETYGAYNLLFAARGTITKIDKPSLQKIQTLAESETRLKWQCFFAIAATKIHAFELLPWLIETIKKTSYAQDGTIDYYPESYERFRESWIGMILRAIGYLARLLRDNNKDREARPAVEFLHEYYRNLSENTDREIVRGITIALGFLGEWKPILENLNPREPWMYEAARNIFKDWVSPLKKYEYWKAACWILQYFIDHPELVPEVRSTLEELKEYLDKELGYIITSPNDDFPLTPEEKKIYEIEEIFGNKDISYFSRKVSELLTSPIGITKDICLKINEYLSELIPDFPKPKLEYDISNFGEIIKNIWTFAEKNGLERKLGTNVFRWYEHNKNYSEAREVLQKLINIARKNNNKSDEAIIINNLAYEYLLEGEEIWEEGAPLFKEAAKIFYEEKDMYNFNNSRANYLMCKVESNNIDNIEDMKEEINSIAKILTEKVYWHARKPYILRAKIEERENIKEAISFVQKAIEISQDDQTLYSEEDQRYLNNLKEKGM